MQSFAGLILGEHLYDAHSGLKPPIQATSQMMNTWIATTPSIDFDLIIHGEGRIERSGNSVPVANLIARRSKYRPEEPWRIEVRISGIKRDHVVFTLDDRRAPPVFVGTTEDGRLLELRQLRIQGVPLFTKKESFYLYGEAYEVRIGIQTLETKPARLYLSAELSDNAVAMPLIDALWPTFDGKRIGKRARKQRSIPTSLGPLRLWKSSWTDKVSIGGRDAEVEQLQSVANVTVPKSKRTVAIPGVVDTFQEILRELGVILTLLSRRHVGCCHIALMALDDSRAIVAEGEVWQAAPKHAVSGWRNGLVNPKRVPDHAIDHAIRTLRAHRARPLLRSAISYLAECRTTQSIEAGSLYAFTALEAAVNALQDEEQGFSLDETTFSQLRQHLHSSIKREAPQIGLSAMQRRDVYAKLNELRRRPIVDRVLELCEHYALELNVIWPNIKSHRRALGMAFQRRNSLFHSGRMDDPVVTFRDSLRIAALAERMIYYHLGGHSDWISPLADLDFHGMPADMPDPWAE